jgi:hypothetical protein
MLYFKAEARRYKVEVNTILDLRLKNLIIENAVMIWVGSTGLQLHSFFKLV